MSDAEVPVPPSKHGKTPLWVWFAVINTVVVIVVAGGIVAWLRGSLSEGGALSAVDQDRMNAPLPILPKDAPVAARPPAGAAPSGAASPRSTEELVAAVQNGVVLLTSYGSNRNKVNLATGFLMDSTGLIATNFHALRYASSAEVEFHNHEKIPVKGVRAWSMACDLAILELASLPKQASVLELSTDADRPNGADVISIGHPQEFKFTTTTGIVSAVHKTADLPIQYQQSLNARADHIWLQTTAAISGGSSGGPLLNRSGAVIGINTWVSGSYSFAIDARHLLELRQSMGPSVQSLEGLTGPDEQLANLLGEFQHQASTYNLELSRTSDPAQRQVLIDTRHPAADYAARLYEFAAAHQRVPVAFDAVQWLCSIGAQPSAPARCDETLRRAADLITAQYLDEPKLAALIWGLRSSSRPGAWHLCEQVAEKAAQRELRGVALFCAGVAKQASAREAERADAQRLLEEVVGKYADVIYHCSDPRHPQHVMGTEAQEALYQLKNLSVGRSAMEIEGPGLDGAEFKLSDYRGKVVVLDFWVDWCPPCQQMWPHERKMVAELKNAPFALVGVFGEDHAKLQSLVDAEKVTWKNWTDGKNGPISTQWRISSFPTIYVLDHTGVIRQRAVGRVPDAQLSQWVKDLLAEIPAASDRTLP